VPIYIFGLARVNAAAKLKIMAIRNILTKLKAAKLALKV
jgi:hypothetical protein